MSASVVNSVEALLHLRAKSLEDLTLSWFGGEPMLALDIVYKISLLAKQLAKENSFPFLGAMTTNGSLLSRDVLRQLVDCGVIQFQVSLDGLDAVHDRTRRSRNGNATFEKIITNLIAARQTSLSFEILLRVHFSPNSLESTEKLVDYLNREFGEDDRFRVHLASIERLRDDQTFIKEFSVEGRQTAKQSLERKLKSGFSAEAKYPTGQYICYASKPNAFVIRSDGNISKCTVGLDDPRNSVGVLQRDGKIKWFQDKLQPWHEGIITRDARTLACPYDVMKQRGKDGTNCKSCSSC